MTGVKWLFSMSHSGDDDGPGRITHTLATCGEDTFISLLQLTEGVGEGTPGLNYNVVDSIQGHLSSVRCLAVSHIPQSLGHSSCNNITKVLFSAGGRAQLKAWRISITMDFCEDVRYAWSGNVNFPSRSRKLQHEILGYHNLCEKPRSKRKPWKVAHYDPSPETRYMDIATFFLPRRKKRRGTVGTELSDLHAVICACSDGFVR